MSATIERTSAFLHHFIHLNTTSAPLRLSIKVARFSYVPPARSSTFTSSRPSYSVQAPMPQTRSQAKKRALLFQPRSNSLLAVPLETSVSAVLNRHESALSQSPHYSQNAPSKAFAVDQQPIVPSSLSSQTDASHSARKRGQHSLDKQADPTVQKRPHMHAHRKYIDIEDAPSPPSPDSAKHILQLLRSFYHSPLSTATHPKTKLRKAILDSLVATILSQATTNTNSSRAFKKLKTRFTSWESALEAGPEEIEACIACGGLAQAKSKVIHDILYKLKTEHKACSLEFIRDLPTDEVKKVLCSFKGVGPKTASCVLMFAMDRPEFPVDTHVRRIAGRLGWMPPSSTPERTYERLNSCLPDDTKHELHVLLVEHGRKTCKASSPLCAKCPLMKVCHFSES